MATLTTVQIGDQRVQVTAQPLTQEAFAPYGAVIHNPRPDIHPSTFDANAKSLPANAFAANQGYAIQYRNVSPVRSLYDQSPSGKGNAVMSMFVCSTRALDRADSHDDKFTVKLLERHPYTTQTFAPVSSAAHAYLIVVAPSLAPSSQDSHLCVPTVGDDLPGRGLPDLRGLRAFVATAAQAVTYGAGTWHAPMVVLGPPGTTMDFVVSQSMSGVPVEDCQLIEFTSGNGGEPNVEVRVPRPAAARNQKL